MIKDSRKKLFLITNFPTLLQGLHETIKEKKKSPLHMQL